MNPKLAGSLSANICANLLGLGNAATPMGIDAAKQLRDPEYAVCTEYRAVFSGLLDAKQKIGGEIELFQHTQIAAVCRGEYVSADLKMGRGRGADEHLPLPIADQQFFSCRVLHRVLMFKVRF